MADYEDPQEVWDEYEWERFLQQQDRNAEKYFGLLEEYMDHPDRDEIIAREMGWTSHSSEEDDDELDEEAPEFLPIDAEESIEEEMDNEFEKFSQTPVYRDTLKLHIWINNFMDRHPELKEHPEAIRLATRSAVCGAKLAAALCGDNQSEIGMTIAFLKRGLKAANDSLDAGHKLCEAGILPARQRTTLNRHIFRLRDRVVDLMSEYRAEWRRRYGHH